MKIIISILFFCVINNTFSQNNYPFTDTTKLWNNLSGGYGAFFVVCNLRNISIKFKGDTLIDSKHYLKVFEANDSIQQDWQLIGYIHEEKIDSTVYFRDTLNNQGQLYDFGIALGDTVSIDNVYMGTLHQRLICGIIDSIFINGIYKKRYHLGYYYAGNFQRIDTWIEDIGSTHGLLYCGHSIPGGFRYLLCYSESDSLVYLQPPFNTCYEVDIEPKITSKYFDTGYVNNYYDFQIEISETDSNDIISFRGWVIPEDFWLDETNGIIYGYPSSTGIFDCIVTVENCGFGTDLIMSPIIIQNPTPTLEFSLKNDFNIYPNPANKKFYIEPSNKISEDFYLEIYNLMGLQLFKKRLVHNKINEINCNTYPNGVYLLILRELNSNRNDYKYLIFFN
ncbi:MAG: T9SS type A sorting domain-containing protein [Bacteroidales bacterium]|nr:T9SS type A sorting domain-containing protein [Bacteroidales bacterium]